MPILSALDCISPAFGRTKLVLFSPFRAGRTWKLSLTAYLTVASGVYMPVFLLAFFFLSPIRQAGGSMAVTLVSVGALIATLLSLGLFHLLTRLRFAFFDIVLNRGQFVAPAWRKYGSQAFRWSVFKVVLGTAALSLVAVPTAAFVRHFVATVSVLKPGEQPPPDFVFSLMSGYFLIYGLFWLFLWASSLLSDFVVPSLALEDTTLAEAFRRVGVLIRTEPAQFTIYAVTKLVLAVAGYMAIILGLEIGIVIVGIVVGLICALIGFLLHLAGVSIAVLTVLGVLVLLAFYLFALWVIVFGMGVVFVFLEAYSLYFLSGRYPMLGELLAASTPVVAARGPLYPDPYPAYVPPPPQA
ncbi:DUF7544 domain-containing protein [Granulicella paludicola]|uniref:DUF7544 domain-containing protein n=1 Tax=Granulicella paludicola TaxID=474951 RepID=UPI0021E089FB|nr:hypothetical protein [Granulicella paludicola]